MIGINPVTDYKNRPDAEVIAEIVRLAEETDDDPFRKFSYLIVNFVEDCTELKNGRAIDQLLVAMLEIDCNHARIVIALRTSFSVRKSIEQWYRTRDVAIEILQVHEPLRAARLMAGLLETQPGYVEEMDGLNAWESIVKTMRNMNGEFDGPQ